MCVGQTVRLKVLAGHKNQKLGGHSQASPLGARPSHESTRSRTVEEAATPSTLRLLKPCEMRLLWCGIRGGGGGAGGGNGGLVE